ncbi:hypothetical protein CYR55_23065, partial [Chimaeribacter californicus]
TTATKTLGRWMTRLFCAWPPTTCRSAQSWSGWRHRSIQGVVTQWCASVQNQGAGYYRAGAAQPVPQVEFVAIDHQDFLH